MARTKRSRRSYGGGERDANQKRENSTDYCHGITCFGCSRPKVEPHSPPAVFLNAPFPTTAPRR